MKVLMIMLGVVVTLLVLVVVGLKVQPKALPDFSSRGGTPATVPLPEGLPAPVARYYQEVYGDEIPVFESAVISGRASMRINGIYMPGRFRFTHIAGQGYRHYIEATLFGIPIFKVNEHYLDGKGQLDLPFGVFEGAQVNQAANLGMWSESMWLPAIYVTDPRARWEPVDAETAILVVPFGQDEQHFVVRFDPETGLLCMMESMRYRDAEGGGKILWLNEATHWKTIDGYLIPEVGAVTWLDEGSPWAVFTAEDVVYNADVADYIQATGP